jgi:hypothetical protein
LCLLFCLFFFCCPTDDIECSSMCCRTHVLKNVANGQSDIVCFLSRYLFFALFFFFFLFSFSSHSFVFPFSTTNISGFLCFRMDAILAAFHTENKRKEKVSELHGKLFLQFSFFFLSSFFAHHCFFSQL